MLGIILILLLLLVYCFRGFFKALGTLFILCFIATLLGKWFLIGCVLIGLALALVIVKYKK